MKAQVIDDILARIDAELAENEKWLEWLLNYYGIVL